MSKLEQLMQELLEELKKNTAEITKQTEVK